MKARLRALLVEGSDSDAKLVLHELRRAGHEVDFERVEEEGTMRAALARGGWDVVLSDWAMPRFSAPDALRVLNESTLDVPFIIVSGTVGEETAVEAMRAGAQDYVLKAHLGRLGPAVERGLRERQVRDARRSAEQALRASETRYRRIVETTNQGVWIIDADYNTSFMNAKMAQMLGYDAEEVRGRPVYDFVRPEDREMVARTLELRRKGVDGQNERQLRRKDGTTFWALVESSAIFDDARRYEGSLAMVMDVSGRKRAEEESRLLQTIALAVSEADNVASALQVVIRKVCEITGWRSGAAWMAQRDGSKLTCEASWPPSAAAAGLRAALAVPVAVGGEVVAVLEWFMDQPREEDDRSLQLVSSVGAQLGSVIQRKRAEEALRASEEQVRLLLDSTGDGIYGIDLEGRCTFANAACVRMLGYLDQRDLIGKNMHQLIHSTGADQESHPQEECPIYEAALGEGRAYVGPEVFWRADGTGFPVQARSFPLRRNEAGVGAVVSFTDISSRTEAQETLRRTEEQLRQAQKMEAVGQLAGGIAHDFNNLLAVILSSSSFLLDELDLADPRREDAEEIKLAAERAAALTRQLLAFSRRQMVEPRVIDLNSVIAGMEKMLRRLIGEDVELTTSLVPGLGSVKADAGQMEQVILNLAVNARDAMPRGGKLRLETGNVDLDTGYAVERGSVQPGPYVVLAVGDTGVGMDAALQDRIFEPFFTTKEKGKGTGLGLSICYGIVKQSGGYIWVYSEPGRGTVFEVYLPRVQGEVERPAERSAPADLRGTETVLLVEDDERVRAVAQKILESKGYQVIACRDGDEALAVAAEHQGRVDLVLTDVVMPGMSGVDLVDQLQKTHRDTKILFMSGYMDRSFFRGAVDPAVNLLQKPFTPETLTRKVREVLGS